MLSFRGSSHTKRYSSFRPWVVSRTGGIEHTGYDKYLKNYISSCKSYSGLTILGQYYESDSLKKVPEKINKKIQLSDFLSDIKDSDATATLFVLLSNDWKTLLTDHEGHLLKLEKDAKAKWDKLSPKEKINYNAYQEKPWKKSTKDHIHNQFEKYEKILKETLMNSTLEHLYHSSILERIHPKIKYLPFLFAILNSVLRKYLNDWSRNKTFKNKNNVPIKCHFVNVSFQFFNSSNPELLFDPDDYTCELTHRTGESMDELVVTWRDTLLKVLNT